jgi:hypothetical protein
MIHKQDNSLIFSNQQKVVRILAMTSNPIQKKTDDEIRNFFNFPKNNKNLSQKNIEQHDIPSRLYKIDISGKLIENFDIINSHNETAFDLEYNNIKKYYKSDYIFNFAEPLITKILNPYMKKLFGYNVLYLLANYKNKIKKESICHHQYKLLQNTMDFISSIVDNTQ